MARKRRGTRASRQLMMQHSTTRVRQPHRAWVKRIVARDLDGKEEKRNQGEQAADDATLHHQGPPAPPSLVV
jgi:hypothetical protein